MKKTYRGKVAPTNIGDKYVPLLARLILDNPQTLTVISNRSTVSQTTMRNWIAGKTKRPMRATMDNVLNVVGYRMGVMPMAFKPSEELQPVKPFTWAKGSHPASTAVPTVNVRPALKVKRQQFTTVKTATNKVAP